MKNNLKFFLYFILIFFNSNVEKSNFIFSNIYPKQDILTIAKLEKENFNSLLLKP